MNRIVLDASAILTFLQGESGAKTVTEALDGGQACCSAANWSEVCQKVRHHGADWLTVEAVLTAYGMTVEEVTRDDAVVAADLWSAHPTLSLGDRLCLALATRLGVSALTTDRAWSGLDRAEVIR
ncbi:MAG: type II toxin-antitoxin system VapC family toxin [Propionibacteriaceae bacterium]|nr:type II toxin-antitoxin system VapC family toxin [Propionibacteriaceae bacterium]